MDEETALRGLDDCQVIEERARVADQIAALADLYRALTREMCSRGTLQWMLR